MTSPETVRTGPEMRDGSECERERERLAKGLIRLEHKTQRFERALLAELDALHGEVARELHDCVGSTLTGVTLILATVRPHLNDQDDVRSVVDKALEQVTLALESLRRISRGIIPAGTDGGAILQALDQYACDFAVLHGVQVRFRARGSQAALDAETGNHIYRVVQEASTNAVRHGSATRISIRLLQCGGRYRLVIADNGSGFDAGDEPDGAGVGLRSMATRAKLMGGVAAVRSRKGSGCVVRVTWPVPNLHFRLRAA